jgi:rhodanese-related sulfurtransferase
MEKSPSIISREDLLERINRDEDFTLVEVLSEESYREAHLPGAVNLPGTRIREGIRDIAPDEDRTVVVYCANPSCTASDKAAKILVGLGYTDVRHYRGGKQHWMEGGLEVEAEEPATASA